MNCRPRARGAEIVTFNPLRERGLERFVNPQSPREMLTPDSTVISTQYHQLAIGGDMAAIAGMCKALFAMDDLAIAEGRRGCSMSLSSSSTPMASRPSKHASAATPGSSWNVAPASPAQRWKRQPPPMPAASG